jgi:3-oxoacyl-[acyl-carrier-protein] synthase III
MTRRTRIAGTGHYVPRQVVTNQDLERVMDTSDAWIMERTVSSRFTADGDLLTWLPRLPGGW